MLEKIARTGQKPSPSHVVTARPDLPMEMRTSISLKIPEGKKLDKEESEKDRHVKGPK